VVMFQLSRIIIIRLPAKARLIKQAKCHFFLIQSFFWYSSYQSLFYERYPNQLKAADTCSSWRCK
jgi:hypothetical protein